MSYNPGLLFYKHYYEDRLFTESGWNDEKHKEYFDKKNKQLFDFQFPGGQFGYAGNNGLSAFSLSTTYPGLLIGTGYTHGSNKMGEFKIGFFFDHTSGLPVIPGSSIKGVIRSAFPCQYEEKAKALEHKSKTAEAGKWKKLANGREKFIKSLLSKLGYELPEGKTIQHLENEIFEGLVGTDRENSEHHFPMNCRDIFHDAVIEYSGTGKIFADDYVTPHKNNKNKGIPDAMKNPIPIQLLKVLPEVDFSFHFDLKKNYYLTQEGEENDTIEIVPRILSPGERLELFRQILLFLGVGAKTNVGYGKWKPKHPQTPRIGLGLTGKTSKPIAGTNKPVQDAPVAEVKQELLYKPLRKGEKVQAIVVKDAKTPPMHIALKLMVIAEGQEQIAYYRYPAGRETGTKAVVEIQEIKPILRIANIKW